MIQMMIAQHAPFAKRKVASYDDCWDGPNAANQPKARKLQIEKRDKEQKSQQPAKEDKQSSSKNLN